MTCWWEQVPVWRSPAASKTASSESAPGTPRRQGPATAFLALGPAHRIRHRTTTASSATAPAMPIRPVAITAFWAALLYSQIRRGVTIASSAPPQALVTLLAATTVLLELGRVLATRP